MEYEIEKTEIFDKWLRKLKDRPAAVAIIKRLGRAKLGNFGDVEPVGEGVSEMRILPAQATVFITPSGKVLLFSYFVAETNRLRRKT